MAKTVAEIMSEASIRLDDEGAHRFVESTLRVWIWEGAREVARRSECLRARAEIPVLANDQSVTGPTDAIRVTHAYFAPTGETQIYPLEYMDRRALDPIWGVMQGIDTSHTPAFYTMWGFPPALTIQFSPIPSGAGTLLVDYYRMPASINPDGSDDGDTIDLPEGWEDLILTYVEARGYRKDRRLEDYTAAMADFAQQVDAITQAAQRFTDSPGEILYSPMWPGYTDLYT